MAFCTSTQGQNSYCFQQTSNCCCTNRDTGARRSCELHQLLTAHSGSCQHAYLCRTQYQAVCVSEQLCGNEHQPVSSVSSQQFKDCGISGSGTANLLKVHGTETCSSSAC